VRLLGAQVVAAAAGAATARNGDRVIATGIGTGIETGIETGTVTGIVTEIATEIATEMTEREGGGAVAVVKAVQARGRGKGRKADGKLAQ